MRCPGKVLWSGQKPGAKLKFRLAGSDCARKGRGRRAFGECGSRRPGGRRLRIGAGSDAFDGGQEAIAAAGQSLNKSGAAGGVAEGFADAIDRRVDAVLVVDEGSVGPELARDLFAREQLAGELQIPLQKHEQHLERLRVQFDAQSLPAQFARGGVRLKDSKAIAPDWPRVGRVVRHVCRSV